MTRSPIIVHPQDVTPAPIRSDRQRPAHWERAVYRRGRARVRREGGPTNVSLWLPVTPFFWLLSPFAILLAPLLALAPPLRGVNPYAAVVLIGHVLISLSGTKVHVDTPDVRVRITIL